MDPPPAETVPSGPLLIVLVSGGSGRTAFEVVQAALAQFESPDVRRAAGKPEQGRLALKAYQQGGNIHIEVCDDGKGLDRDKIHAKARDLGLAGDEPLTDEQVFGLIFRAGFSTADRITEVSGRGVGMDVVRQNVEALGGSIAISSERGNGTTFRIKLPLNWQTRNIYGTLFGGAMYAATDPLYALLIKVGLGRGYIVWDKAGTIRYKKPGRTDLFAECSISDAELKDLRERLEHERSVDLDYEITLVDSEGVVHAIVMKTIYVARKESYARKVEHDSVKNGTATG